MELENILSKKSPFKDLNVAIIGDLMLDTFIDGTVARISPEAPVPIVQIKSKTESLGGAGNTAANILSLGATPILISKIGKDDAGKSIKAICKKNKLDATNFIVTPEPTISKTRITSQGQHIVRIDDEAPKKLSPTEHKAIEKILRDVRKKADVIVVSDYAKGMIDQNILDSVKKIWKTGLILVDPKPRKEIDYTDVNLITPNFKESLELLNITSIDNSDQEAENIVKKLARKFKLNSVLLTRSKEGATLLVKNDKKNEITHKKVVNVKEIRDVSGAGDTVISMIAVSLAFGLSLTDAVTIANKAASIVVAKPGTVTVTWPEITKALRDSGDFPDFMFR